MRLVKPSIEYIWATESPLEVIERAGRTCYKSEDKITGESSARFVEMLVNRGHEAMVEHVSASYRVICDRGVTHEIVRHRLFSFAQESTRYCNYKGGVAYIIPSWMPGIAEGELTAESLGEQYGAWGDDDPRLIWLRNMLVQERAYLDLLTGGWQAQQARSVLPNSLKTEIIITGNLRQWRQFLRLRCDRAAHPQMREVAGMILDDIMGRIPVLFGDFEGL